MSDRCAGGVKLKLGKRCSVCDAGPGDQCAKASLRDFEERQALIKALRSLTNEMVGIWDAFEYGLRHEISNTNYAVAREKLAEAERVLAAVSTEKQP